VESSEQQFSAAGTRMMKAQEVILKAAAGKLRWWEAAEIIGVTGARSRARIGFESRRKMLSTWQSSHGHSPVSTT